MGTGAHRIHDGDVLYVMGIVHQTTQMDLMGFAQMPEQLEYPDLLALVGRIGDALGEEKKIGHGAYARLRLMKGEIVLATGIGRRCQAAIILA